MKSIKKLLSIVMVLAMVLALGVNAFAVDITVTDDNSTGSTYHAYRLLNAEYVRTDTIGGEKKDIYKYTLNTEYTDAIQAGIDAVDADSGLTVGTSDINDVLDFLRDMNADQTRDFGGAVYKAIGVDTDGDANIEAPATTFTGLAQGYYLITETVADGSENGSASLVMLDTAGKDTVTVTTKEDVPSSKKEVKDKNDTTGVEDEWSDSADYDIGDAVPYKLSATINVKDLSSYESYYLAFVDTMCKGLTFNQESVKVTIDGKIVEPNPFDITTETLGEDDAKYPGGTKVNFVCNNIKDLIHDGSEVVIEYTATLDADAVIGNPGNPNEMHIEYSNSPYNDQKGKTPDDKAIVFTYDLDVNKVDGDNKALEGAEFALYKEVPEGTDGAFQLTKEGEKVIDGKVGDKEVSPDDLLTGWYIDSPNALKVDEANKALFTAEGLDDGNYVIVETKAPDGYNKAAPIPFTLTATHTVDSTNVTSPTAEQKFTVTMEPAADEAIIDTTVVNRSGVELPETGGIGTTIFYVVGAILVVGAVILLVTKRRMTGAEK